MPARKNGDSKQGLIIGLVCFVVLSLLLAVSTFYGFSGQKELEEKAKTAKKDADTALANRNWWKFQALLLKSYLGKLPASEQQDWPGLWDQFKGGSLKGGSDAEATEVSSLVRDTLEKDYGKIDDAQKRPESTIGDRLAVLNRQLEDTAKKLAKDEADLKAQKADYEQKTAANEATLKTTQAELEKAHKTNEKDRSDRATELETRLKEFGDLNRKVEDLTKKDEVDVVTAIRKNKEQQAIIKDLNKELDKLRRQLSPPDLATYASPKGKVVRLDPKGDVLWIDLGSADNVRPHQNLTFSVFGPDRVRKGSIEVTEVLNPHLSMARITETVDPNRNPMMPGDVLINPAWSPNLRTHVAIAGLIDLTGDGKDSSEEFVHNLTRQGMVIDTLLDLKDASVKGPGMTVNTEYFILGEVPDFGGGEKEGSSRFERKKELSEKITELKKMANDLGITVVSVKRFAALTGYQMPRATGLTQGSDYERGLGTGIKTAEPKQPEKKPAAKEAEKKEEDSDKDKDKDSDKDKDK
jgi:hypothetical protein